MDVGTILDELQKLGLRVGKLRVHCTDILSQEFSERIKDLGDHDFEQFALLLCNETSQNREKAFKKWSQIALTTNNKVASKPQLHRGSSFSPESVPEQQHSTVAVSGTSNDDDLTTSQFALDCNVCCALAKAISPTSESTELLPPSVQRFSSVGPSAQNNNALTVSSKDMISPREYPPTIVPVKETYRPIQCIQCGQYIQAVSLKAHQEVECLMRPEKCAYCHQEVPSQQMEDHIKKVCPDVLHKCPNGCNSKLEFKLPELHQHLAVTGGDCPLSEVSCPYAIHGCSFVSLRKNLPTHMDQYQVYHVQIQCNSFMEMKSATEKQTSTMQHLMERVGSLESRTNAIERLQDAIEQRVELLDERRERHLDRYEGKIETLEEQATRTSSTLTQLTRRVDDLHLTAGINYSTVASGYETDAQPATSSHLLGLNVPLTGGGASSQRVDALQGRVVEVEHGVDRALSSSLDQELRIQLLERATYNGVLIWKIDEFERRRKEAMDGVTMSLYSTPFYTSRHGYKMCCRIYLNGDGLGKGTHLSFFFVIMRGPFDGLLEWPFKQKVTLTLLNQTERRSVTDSFRPDAQSSSFLRPLRHEMNIASGCPMFVKLTHLMSGGFIKDDCIYVRAVVDTTDLPKYP